MTEGERRLPVRRFAAGAAVTVVVLMRAPVVATESAM
jgi:hypothetical protein